MSRFFSRGHRYFPRTCAVLALIALVIPPYDGDPARYYFVVMFFLLPWLISMLDVLFGVGRDSKGGSHPGDTGGSGFGDGGGGGDCGGGGE